MAADSAPTRMLHGFFSRPARDLLEGNSSTGAKPADLLVEQRPGFDLLINLKTARVGAHGSAFGADPSDPSDRVTSDHARRRSLLTASLGFALLDTRGKPVPPEVQTVRTWLDNWQGVRHVVTRMNRQGYMLHLSNIDAIEMFWREESERK